MSHLFIFDFVVFVFAVKKKKITAKTDVKEIMFLPMYSSSSFMVSGLIFKSFHFELIFVYGVR